MLGASWVILQSLLMTLIFVVFLGMVARVALPGIPYPLFLYSASCPGLSYQIRSPAAHLEPDVLILDEVVAVGDAAFQVKCQQKMRQVRRQGHTVFFVSHNREAIKESCNRVFVISEGKLTETVQVGSAIDEYLRSQYAIHSKSGTSSQRESY